MHIMDEMSALHRLGDAMSLEVVDLLFLDLGVERLTLIPEELIRRHHVIPLEKQGDVLRVATFDPYRLSAFDEIRIATGFKIRPVLASRSQILGLIRRHFPGDHAGM